MIALVSGILRARDGDTVLIETSGGVGYSITLPLGVVERLPALGSKVQLHTELVVKEDGWALFGFDRPAERVIFQRLLTASGFGPRLALALLSTLGADRTVRSIRQKDIAALSTVSGIGKKKAESSATTEQCQQSESRKQRNSLFGAIAGSIAGSALGSAGASGAMIGLAVPIGTLMTTEILSKLDCKEQVQAAKATDNAVRGGVGTSSAWTSETRANVSGSSTVTGEETQAKFQTVHDHLSAPDRARFAQVLENIERASAPDRCWMSTSMMSTANILVDPTRSQLYLTMARIEAGL